MRASKGQNVTKKGSRSALIALSCWLVLASGCTPWWKVKRPFGCHGDNSAERAVSYSFVEATLARTGCFGTCPIYMVRVEADGSFVYVGEPYVKTRGKIEGRVTPEQIAALQRAFRAADYFNLTNRFDCYEVTDSPSALTAYHSDTQDKTIKHYHGCWSACGAASLSALENNIDTILEIEKFIGTEKEQDPRLPENSELFRQ